MKCINATGQLSNQELLEGIKVALASILNNAPIKNVYIGEDSPAPAKKYFSRVYDRLIIVLDGVHEVDIAADGKQMKIEQQKYDAMWLPRNTWNYFYFKNTETVLTIPFNTSDPSSLLLKLHTSHITSENKWYLDILKIKTSVPSALYHICHAMSSVKNQEKSATHLINALIGILLKVLEGYQSDNDNPSSNQYRWQCIYQFLLESFLTDINRLDVADRFGITPNHLTRLFSQNCNMGFTEKLNELRLSYAADLIKQRPDLRIKEIAGECGYTPKYFIRLFQKRFNCTPSSYRKFNIHN
jgi:AraC-like DNA-binding protein